MNGASQKPISLLLADDQRLFTDNLKLMLETLSDDIRVTAIAANGREAVDMAIERQPDLVLMDVSMPVMDGVEAARVIHQRRPEIKIVMLTTFPDDTYVQEALRYGAYGYILKNMRSEDLIASIRAAASGAALFSPGILEKIFPGFSKGDDRPRDTGYQDLLNRLGKREKEILGLVAKGFNNQKIADTLFISEPTVRNYISSIYAKIGTKDRLEVISIARKGHVED